MIPKTKDLKDTRDLKDEEPSGVLFVL